MGGKFHAEWLGPRLQPAISDAAFGHDATKQLQLQPGNIGTVFRVDAVQQVGLQHLSRRQAEHLRAGGRDIEPSAILADMAQHVARMLGE